MINMVQGIFTWKLYYLIASILCATTSCEVNLVQLISDQINEPINAVTTSDLQTAAQHHEPSYFHHESGNGHKKNHHGHKKNHHKDNDNGNKHWMNQDYDKHGGHHENRHKDTHDDNWNDWGEKERYVSNQILK